MSGLKSRRHKTLSKWYEEAVFYHMYPIGMTGAPRQNTQEEVTHRFPELMEWLPYVQSLGCTAIYIGPLFESTSHGYDTRDYKLVDRRLGDNEDFKAFVAKAHELGIKIVVDGVFNHTGREFFAFKDIQQNRENSPYCSWFKGINFGWNSPYNDGFGYEAWRNCFELVNLNYWEPKVREYILSVIGFWIDEFDIDGIRLDCADCLEFSFMEEMRRYTNEKKADFWLMGEVIHGDYSRWVNDEMLHSVTNYELHKGLYSGHNDHNYFEIAHSIKRLNDICRGRRLYTFVDNHDVARIASKLQNKAHLPLVTILLYTVYGIPSVYYGSEFGIEGQKEQGSDWNLRPALSLADYADAYENNEITKLCRKLGQLKKEYAELTNGTYQELILTNRQFAFGRILDGKECISALNCDDAQASFEIPLCCQNATAKELLDQEAVLYEVTDRQTLKVTLPANTGTVFYVE